jgi:hypothetical protein
MGEIQKLPMEFVMIALQAGSCRRGSACAGRPMNGGWGMQAAVCCALERCLGCACWWQQQDEGDGVYRWIGLVFINAAGPSFLSPKVLQ